MRVDPNLVTDMIAAVQQSQQTLQTALQQVATGKSVNQPSDNPAASAEMVQNTIDTADVDQYTQNVSSVLSTVQTADSALSSVVSSLTQAISVGTEGANGTNSASNEQSLAAQVQGILSSVLSQANMAYQGSYLFGGTATTTTPYAADASSPSGYAYNGNDDVNSVQIGDTLRVQVNIPGSQIFSNANASVLGSLSSLVSALKSGNTTAIGTATTAVSAALNYVSQQRVIFNLSSQATALVGVNLATAATNLSQAETDNNAALAAEAKVLPNTLLNYLSPPA